MSVKEIFGDWILKLVFFQKKRQKNSWKSSIGAYAPNKPLFVIILGEIWTPLKLSQLLQKFDFYIGILVTQEINGFNKGSKMSMLSALICHLKIRSNMSRILCVMEKFQNPYSAVVLILRSSAPSNYIGTTYWVRQQYTGWTEK